jgi:OOP family OmpA-OmpF porin
MKFARRKVAAAAAAVIVSMASQYAIAQDDDAPPPGSSSASSGNDAEKNPLSYVGIMGSYLDLDKKRDATHGVGVSAYYGRQIGQGNWFWEGQIFTDNNETHKGDFTDFYRSGARPRPGVFAESAPHLLAVPAGGYRR